MNRVFVFCIGGTGLRVMKSVIMLLASGFRTNGYQIVPIIIDPHQDLKEKTELDALIANYQKIYDATVGERTEDKDNSLEGFWNTRIITLQQLDNQQNPTSSSLAYERAFREYIELGNLDPNDPNQLLIQALYSEANLNNKLSVGFKGNPNVGTVVLGDMIEGADEFEGLKRQFNENDRIFIISSIFGGTGASGYPLLEKSIRGCDSCPKLKEATMGAVTVFPYFALEDPTTTGSSIDSANFLTKTKAALAYYADNVLSNYLYYVGEKKLRKSYKNNEQEQEDPAHFIELVAASALFDFLKQERQNTTQYMTRAIRDDQEVLNIASAGDGYKPIAKSLADMMLLKELLEFWENENHSPLKTSKWHLDERFFSTEPYTDLKSFLKRFSDWYGQMASNERGFNPLNINSDMTDPIKGMSVEGDRRHYVLDMINCSQRDKARNYTMRLRHLMESAYQAIDKYTGIIIKGKKS